MLLPQYSFQNDSPGQVLLDLAVRFVLNCPPADLSTAERLFFQIEEAHWFYEDFARVDNTSLPAMKLRTFVDRLFTAVPLLYQYQPDPLSALTTFQSYKSLIPVRGGIILNEKMDKVLMVKGWRSGSSWGFPKGKINQNEPDSECAIREVYEETGFDMTPYLVEKDYFEVTRQGKNIRLYVVRGVPESTVFETQTRKEISKISWHNVHKLPSFHKNSGSATANYYMAAPFMSGLKKYINKSKGLATSLTIKETNALKNMLPQVDFQNDEEAAQNLLNLLKPQSQSPANPASAGASDRSILLNLIKGGGQDNAVESAQQVLGLYQSQIGEQQLVEPIKIVLPEHYKNAKEANVPMPPLPPSSELQRLVAARKGNQGAGLLSILSTPQRSTPLQNPKNNLLDLLAGPEAPQPTHAARTHAQATLGGQPHATLGGQPQPNSLMSLLDKPSNDLMHLLKGGASDPQDPHISYPPHQVPPPLVEAEADPREAAAAQVSETPTIVEKAELLQDTSDASVLKDEPVMNGTVNLLDLLHKSPEKDLYPSEEFLKTYLDKIVSQY